MSKKFFYPFAVALCTGLAITASTAAVDSSSPPSAVNDASLAVFADLVKETELRRRVNVLYPNPQSIFDGFQIGYVSVRHGNLTFRRRDIVSGINPLARIVRVYDSRVQTGRDFGPGWRLSLAEELTVKDGGLVYTDGSGARHYFARSGDGSNREQLLSEQVQVDAANGSVQQTSTLASGTYTAIPSTPQHASTSIEVAGSLAILRKGNETRVFERSVGTTGGGNTYRLTQLASSAGSFVALSYHNGLVRRISDADGPVFEITRDRRGRITSVQDRWGRDVYYRYDASGKLSEAVDIAGNAWTYEYAAHGQLTRAIGPNERDILRIAYDEMARVRESLSGRQYFFTYTPAETMVSEGTGHSHVFGHNAVGVTDRFDSTNGIWWQLELDERNRVTVIQSSRGGYRYTYGAQGEITNAIETTANGSDTRTYQHDDAGRIASVYSQDGAIITIDYAGGSTRINGPQAQFSFEVLLSGEIAQVEQDGTLVRADYDADGNLAAFHSRADTVQFNQDLAGRISAIQYADGEINQYRYDQLGNRSSIDFGMGGTVRYKHDPAGNIVEVAVTERNGEEKRQSVRIGDMNRVENITYQGIGKLDIAYDRMGRAISFDTGSDVISVEYAGPDRIGRIISRATGATWSPSDDEASEWNFQEVLDARLMVLQNDSTGSSHPDYGIAAFEESSFAAIARDPMSLGVPGLLKARQVLAVAKPLFLGNKQDAMMAFEKPSNAVFQPLEYRSTNCCICIIYYPKSVTSRPVPKDHDDDVDVVCICLPDPSPPPPPSMGVGIDPIQVWPDETSGDNTATITVTTSNVPQGTAVSIDLQSHNDGGHVAHRGTRPLGTVRSASRGIDSEGRFFATFEASEFGGDVRINVTVGQLSSSRAIQVRVPGLGLMPSGDGYFFSGSAAGRRTHPTGEYATFSVIRALKTIAETYKDAYWSDSNPQPSSKRVGYNDMSLIYGGKFDLPANWCTSCSHDEHHEGEQVDTRRNNMTNTQQNRFARIVTDNGGDPQVHDEGTSNEHWHLRF